MMEENENTKAVSMEKLEKETKEVKMGKVSEKLMEEDKAAEAVSMNGLDAEAKQPKVSTKLMAEDEAAPSVSMEELEKAAKESGIKYPEIIDILHQMNVSDEEIKKFPADKVDELNTLGALFGIGNIMVTKEYDDAMNKRDMALVNFLATHDPFKELYEAAAKK